MLDRNKTELTHEVTTACQSWLDERGFKPIETEVPVAEGWIADLACSIIPTHTELQRLKLIPRKPAWRGTAKEQWDAWHRLAESIESLMTCIIEVKTTRADFRGDHKWEKSIPADMAYLSVPAGLISKDEWPLGWGILEYDEATKSIKCVSAPAIQAVPSEVRCGLIYSVAIKRDHYTRYERFRKIQRERCEEQAERTSITRINSAIKAALAIAAGLHGSPKEAFDYHGIRHLSEGTLEQAQELWAVAPEKADKLVPWRAKKKS